MATIRFETTGYWQNTCTITYHKNFSGAIHSTLAASASASEPDGKGEGDPRCEREGEGASDGDNNGSERNETVSNPTHGGATIVSSEWGTSSTVACHFDLRISSSFST